ncbi:hypothetical protein HDV01_004027 [Terramyces sp. JEL0728]|nr:hypothetical protein HDV01_004027 [Terramyces sp. JEL0728]
MFDVCISDIFVSLSHSATLVLRDSNDYFKVLKDLDTININTNALTKISPNHLKKNARIVIGGEKLSFLLKEKWCKDYVLINAYGPSETTITSSAALIQPGKPVTIGKPLANTVQYIVDKSLNLVPIGVTGELIIGGLGVSQGYLKRSDLTAEKFIPNHFENDGTKMYRTGDMCRWNVNGDIEILGRVDDMVKVNGYRIELEEVATAIACHPQVENAIAIVKDDMIVAFITPKNVNIGSVRNHVLEILPPYMAPATYISLDRFPMNQNGKIDKNQLKSMEIKVEIEKPVTELEIAMAEIWARLLEVEATKIGRNTSFFALGGDSLTALQFVNIAQRTLGLSISLKDLYSYQVLGRIAGHEHEEDTTSVTPQIIPNVHVSPNLEDLPSNPLKIICFHGQATSSFVMDKQLSELKKRLGTFAEFYFIQARKQVFSNTKLEKYYDSKWYEWWPGRFIRKSQVEATLAQVVEVLDMIGPVDALLGFSQGGSLVELLDRQAHNGVIRKSWNFSILLSGGPLKSITLPWRFTRGIPGGLKTTSIIVKDVNEKLEIKHRYDSNLQCLIEHNYGHVIPQTIEFNRKFGDLILRTAVNERKSR